MIKYKYLGLFLIGFFSVSVYFGVKGISTPIPLAIAVPAVVIGFCLAIYGSGNND